jgi:NADPH-dependent curcumin reductase CurA
MTINRFWRFVAHPVGNDFASALSFEQGPVPTPGDGEVVIRNEYLSLDAGTRMWMTPRTDGYQPPLPLGIPMVGLGVGRVVASNHAGFAPGELVRAFGQWADYSLVRPELSDLRKMDDSVTDMRQHFGVLGMNGWTALWGITETGKAQPGEAVLVSAAAGATGILACQIAKLLGCRVYGLAGGPDKCAYLTDTLGIDGAIDYKAGHVGAQLAAIDGGINVYFDNVGGPLLDDVLPNMAHYGRVALCGLIADYANEGPKKGPAQFDQILMKRLTVTGFFSPDFVDQGDRLTAQLRGWMDAGQLMIPFDQTDGIDHMLEAYAKLFTGANIGKVVVKVTA